MNVLLNNFVLLLFIIFVYYFSKGINKKCSDTHYVPLYPYEIDNIPPEVEKRKIPDTITQHVTTKMGKIDPIYKISFADTTMNFLS